MAGEAAGAALFRGKRRGFGESWGAEDVLLTLPLIPHAAPQRGSAGPHEPVSGHVAVLGGRLGGEVNFCAVKCVFTSSSGVACVILTVSFFPRVSTMFCGTHV